MRKRRLLTCTSKIRASDKAGTGLRGLHRGLLHDCLPVTDSITSLWVEVLSGGSFFFPSLPLLVGA